jgi:hypothetical protein
MNRNNHEEDGMNRKKIMAAALLLALAVTTAVVWADTADPGSSSDPVVTKSYVDTQIAALKSSSTGAETFEVLFVQAGKTILGKEGTELILRSGTALAIDNGANGLSDLTVGSELMGGLSVEKNHLIVIPKEDGRGITAKTDIYVMIKGGYTLK